MGFFSGIGHALSSAVDSVGGFLGKHGDDLFSWGALASDVLGQRSANRQNVSLANSAQNFSAYQAALNRQFQDTMSKNQYQRAVVDLKKAGLNPMLAYANGGNAMPGGSSAAGIAAHVEPVGSARAAFSAAQVAQAKAQANNIKADTANKLAQAGLIQAQTRQVNADAVLKGQQSNTESYRAGQVVNQAALSKAQEDQIRKQLPAVLSQIRAQTSNLNASAEQTRMSGSAIKSLLNSDNALVRAFGSVLGLVLGK